MPVSGVTNDDATKTIEVSEAAVKPFGILQLDPQSVKTRSIFVGGTASHAGKSWVTTAICSYLCSLGIRVAPFKAQNMSNNSCACPGGGEIGRAQAVQAEACGLEPHIDMNPILLKPNSDMGSQVVLHGKPWRNLSARDYYTHHDFLFDEASSAYERLAKRHDYIVIEGAGSVAEINLAATDLTNLAFAERMDAPALLVADIDRGGVFASLAGTMCVLPERHRQRIRSFAVNRFRGDPSLFTDGVEWLEQKLARPCMGVLPYMRDIVLEEEDGVALEGTGATGSPVAVVRMPHISNFNDFDIIAAVDWVAKPNRVLYDFVILPGTKNTVGDLEWMRGCGLDRWLLRQHAAGAQIMGVCGGYQMLGQSITEAGITVEGLKLLPVETIMRDEKTVRPVDALTHRGTKFSAYEIHMGETDRPAGMDSFASVAGEPEGVIVNNCIGTYLHGALQNADVLRELGMEAASRESKPILYARLGEWFAHNADTRLFRELYL